MEYLCPSFDLYIEAIHNTGNDFIVEKQSTLYNESCGIFIIVYPDIKYTTNLGRFYYRNCAVDVKQQVNQVLNVEPGSTVTIKFGSSSAVTVSDVRRV